MIPNVTVLSSAAHRENCLSGASYSNPKFGSLNILNFAVVIFSFSTVLTNPLGKSLAVKIILLKSRFLEEVDGEEDDEDEEEEDVGKNGIFIFSNGTLTDSGSNLAILHAQEKTRKTTENKRTWPILGFIFSAPGGNVLLLICFSLVLVVNYQSDFIEGEILVCPLR